MHDAPTLQGLARRAAALAALAALAGAASAQATDPFAAGERWSHASGAASPWLPDSVCFGAGDEWVAAASRGAGGGLRLFGAHDAPGDGPRGYDPRYASAVGATLVTAGERADAVYALAQFPAPSALARRVEIARHDPLAPARGGSFAPVWVRDTGFLVNGAARIAADESGDVVVAAVHDSAGGIVRVDRIDGVTGALLARRDLALAGLSQLAVSGDGRRVALAGGASVVVLDEAGAVLEARSFASAARALGLSHDGATVAVGCLAEIHVLAADAAGAYSLQAVLPGGASEAAAVVALSSGAESLAVGWWEASGTGDVRLELRDVASGAVTAVAVQGGAPGALQNLPSAVAITPGGERAAFALWGGGAHAEVVLLEAHRSAPVLSLDLPGSARALALDETGTRVAVAHKDAHNTQWGAGGAVRLHDTGERRLVLRATPEAGGTLRAATRHAGAGAAFFALGAPLEQGIPYPGATGLLLLDRGTLRLRAAALDATGTAELALALPADPAWIGARLHVQSIFRVAGGLAFSAERLDALLF